MMQQSSKTTQYLASAVLVGLILPVSLMAQLQSAFVKGSLRAAKETRQEARDTLDGIKATIQELKNADSVDRDALNLAIKEKQAAKAMLIGARAQVQRVRGEKILEKYGGSLSAEQISAYNALTAAAAEAAGIAEQIAVLDVTDPDDLDTIIELKKQLDRISKTKVRPAINEGKRQNMLAIREGMEKIIAEAGATSALQSSCGSAISDFDSAVSAPGAATTGWSATRAAFAAAVGCARTVASEFEAAHKPGSRCEGGYIVKSGRCASEAEMIAYCGTIVTYIDALPPEQIFRAQSMQKMCFYRAALIMQ